MSARKRTRQSSSQDSSNFEQAETDDSVDEELLYDDDIQEDEIQASPRQMEAVYYDCARPLEPKPSYMYNGGTVERSLTSLFCKNPVCQEHRENGEGSVLCMGDMLTYARAIQYKNSRRGMVLFRGGKTYPEERSTFCRMQSTVERRKALKRLLLAVNELRKHYGRSENRYSEGARGFSNKHSVISTIRAMSLFQHYAKESKVETMMLDATKDMRVAVSHAFQGRPTSEMNLCVRLLLVGHPKAVEDLESRAFWSSQSSGPEWLVQRLGDSEMLLVELQTLLPAQALRPQNQAGFLLVHERDLICFHELCQADCNSIGDAERLMDSPCAMSIIGGGNHAGWNALDYPHRNIEISRNVAEDFDSIDQEFFHDMTFPRFKRGQLYPKDDPMKRIIETCIRKVDDDLEYSNT